MVKLLEDEITPLLMVMDVPSILTPPNVLVEAVGKE
jgi:hypothetical protein